MYDREKQFGGMLYTTLWNTPWSLIMTYACVKGLRAYVFTYEVRW